MKKKQSLILLSVFIMIASITLLINKPSYAVQIPGTSYCPETITLVEKGNLELIPGLSMPYWNTKSTSGEELDNLVLTYNKDTENTAATYQKKSESIFPIPILSNNSKENQYYSQIFTWWLIDILNQANNITEEMKEQIINSEMGQLVIKKVEEFQKYMDWEESATGNEELTLDEIDTDSITYYATNDFIETSVIIPDCTKDYSYRFTDYQVDVTSPITVVDINGNEKKEFIRGEGFRLRMPISEMKDGNANFKAKIIANSTFSIFGAYEKPYDISSQSLRSSAPDVMIDCGQKQQAVMFKELDINYTEQVGNLNIKVIDVATRENISNAEIEVYDTEGNIVYRVNTTNSEINVTLPVGDYIVKQIVTPENYQPVIVQKRISVTENETSVAVLENMKLIEVPDLNQKAKGISMILGGLALVIGGILIIRNVRRKLG